MKTLRSLLIVYHQCLLVFTITSSHLSAPFHSCPRRNKPRPGLLGVHVVGHDVPDADALARHGADLRAPAEVSCLCHPPPGDEDLVLLVLVLRKIYPLLRWFRTSASGVKN